MSMRPQTVVSIGFVALLGALPIGHVWLGGLSQARREAEEARRAPQMVASAVAERLASRVSARLSDLAAREAERPFFHWQHFIADPRGVYEGEALVPSPLASGPQDPLVYSYVQIDQRGAVTSPEIFEGKTPPATAAARHALVVAAIGPIEVAEVPFETDDSRVVQQAWVGSEAQAQVAELNHAPTQQRAIISKGKILENRDIGKKVVVQELDNVFYQQNENVADVFEQIQSKGQKRAAPSGGNVAVRVGSFEWRAIKLEDGGRFEPALLAMRSVETPDGPRDQGFVVRAEALAESLVEGGFVARLEPAEPSGGGHRGRREKAEPEHIEAEVRLVDGTVAWRLVIPTLDATREAAVLAVAIEDEALLSAGITTLLSLLVSGLVILVLFQSERLLERRQRFAAAAAHELRTPLAGLRMYAEMLAHGLGRPEKQKIYAERLVTEVARLGRVVSNVLDFSRLEKKSLSLVPKDADVAVLLHELVQRLAPTITAAGADLRLDAHGPLMARFDADAVTQIVTNLVDNAEKYTREHPDRTIFVTAMKTSSGVEIRVRDRGPGLPVGRKGRLFAPFMRGVDKDGPAGLGLGLALSRAMARAQGGDLHPVEPASGGGAELVLTLPPAERGA